MSSHPPRDLTIMALRICSKGRPLASVDSCLSTSTAAPRARSFTTTPASQKQNESKRRLFAWLNAHGTRFKNAPEEPTYLGGPDQPFPYNPLFRSQPVLSEYARQLIWHRVMEQGQPIKAVSALMGIDPRRVAAVVRLKEVEQRMIERVSKLYENPSSFRDETYTNSISLEDTTMVTTFKYP